MSAFRRHQAFFFWHQTADLFFEKMKITAISAIAKGFRAREPDFFQSAICHIVNITKQTA